MFFLIVIWEAQDYFNPKPNSVFTDILSKLKNKGWMYQKGVSLIFPKVSTGGKELSLIFCQNLSTVPYWVSLNRKKACTQQNLQNSIFRKIEVTLNFNTYHKYENHLRNLKNCTFNQKSNVETIVQTPPIT